MIAGRIYLDPGDRLSGHNTPPIPVTVLHGWGRQAPAPDLPWLTWARPVKGAPRNVLVRRTDNTEAVIPFSRRLRIPREPVDLSVFPARVHRACDWPGCPALRDAVAVLSGEPGAEQGWMLHPTFGLRLCVRHVGVWRDGTHVPALVGRAACCSCGTGLAGRTLGEMSDSYIAHLAG